MAMDFIRLKLQMQWQSHDQYAHGTNDLSHGAVTSQHTGHDNEGSLSHHDNQFPGVRVVFVPERVQKKKKKDNVDLKY